MSSGIPFSQVAQTCTEGDSATLPSGVTKIVALAPIFAFPAISLCCDSLLVALIKKDANMFSNKNKHTVPVRATVISAAIILPYVLIGIFLSMGKVGAVTGSKISVFIGAAMIAVRCPASAALTLVAKQKLDRRTRKERQERERNFARQSLEENKQSVAAAATTTRPVLETSL